MHNIYHISTVYTINIDMYVATIRYILYICCYPEISLHFLLNDHDKIALSECLSSTCMGGYWFRYTALGIKESPVFFLPTLNTSKEFPLKPCNLYQRNTFQVKRYLENEGNTGHLHTYLLQCIRSLMEICFTLAGNFRGKTDKYCMGYPTNGWSSQDGRKWLITMVVRKSPR